MINCVVYYSFLNALTGRLRFFPVAGEKYDKYAYIIPNTAAMATFSAFLGETGTSGTSAGILSLHCYHRSW